MEFDYRHRFLPTNDNRIEVETPLRMNIPPAYEPMRRNRWLINFPEEMNLPSWVIDRCERPTLNLNPDGSHHYLPMKIKLTDPIGDTSTSRRLWELLGGITSDTNNIPTTPELREQYSMIRENGLTFDLEMLDPTGVVVSKWTMNGWIQQVSFGNLDYNLSDLVECEIILKPVNVTLHF
jgi:hypothetical protein